MRLSRRGWIVVGAVVALIGGAIYVFASGLASKIISRGLHADLDRVIMGYRQAGLPWTQAELGIVEIKPTENAWIPLAESEPKMRGLKLAKLQSRVRKHLSDGKANLAQVELKPYSLHLAAARQAAKRSNIRQSLDWRYGIWLTESSAAKEFVRLLGLSAEVLAEMGRFDEATAELDSATRLASLLVAERSILGVLTHVQARQLVFASASLVQRTFAKRSQPYAHLRRHFETPVDSALFRASFAGDCYLSLASIRFLPRYQQVRGSINEDEGDGLAEIERQMLASSPPTEGKALDPAAALIQRQFLTRATAMAKLIDQTPNDILAGAQSLDNYVDRYRRSVSSLWFSTNYQSIAVAILRAETRRRAYLAAFEVVRYRSARRSYPTHFRDLGYAPMDPFMPDKPMTLIWEGETLKIYSVGPDKNDDGGTLVRNRNRGYDVGIQIDFGARSKPTALGDLG